MHGHSGGKEVGERGPQHGQWSVGTTHFRINITTAFMYAHRSKQCTLAAQSCKWYGMDAQDVLIVGTQIIRIVLAPSEILRC